MAEPGRPLLELIDELAARWRVDAGRLGERTTANVGALLRELGLVTRDELEAVELRLAQLEHRLRLLEGDLPERR